MILVADLEHGDLARARERLVSRCAELTVVIDCDDVRASLVRCTCSIARHYLQLALKVLILSHHAHVLLRGQVLLLLLLGLSSCEDLPILNRSPLLLARREVLAGLVGGELTDLLDTSHLEALMTEFVAGSG